MKPSALPLTCLLLPGIAGALCADPLSPAELHLMPKLTIVGQNTPDDTASLNRVVLEPTPEVSSRVQDSAALLYGVPGAAVVRNGPQTGILQLRGLHNDRVRVRIDDMTISPACPNHMDPPLHYLTPGDVQKVSVMAGITPVSAGGDSLAGTVEFASEPLRFATNEPPHVWGRVGGSYQSYNDGWGANATVGVAAETWGGQYSASWLTGNDYRFPRGRVRDTGFDTLRQALLFGLPLRRGTLSADVGYLRTREAGTPSLPMDMIEDDGYRGGLRYDGDLGWANLTTRFYRHEINHLMDNFSLRPAGPMRMESPAESDDTGFNAGVSAQRNDHTYRVGLEFHRNAFDAYQRNVATGAPQDTFRGANRNRIGVYTEWQATWSSTWQTLVGVRSDTVVADAEDIEWFFPASAADRAAFNAADHAQTDPMVDATLALRCTPDEASTYEFGVARKSRAPSSLERYLWTPLSASAGQADGRTYLGNLDLDPEVSHQLGFAADWHGATWQVRVTPFYNFVSDYIQGDPIARTDAAGKPVLQFRNLDRADLYGAEFLGRYAIVSNLVLSTTVSYVRGEDREHDAALYRIAPLRGVVALDGTLGRFEGRVEGVFAARQDEVATYNQELPTPGYAVLNLRLGYHFTEKLLLQAGVENVTDNDYADHLGGINRVAGSDVAMGERIPLPGRFVYVSVNWAF